MSGAPYRIPAHAGCEHARERPSSCELCGKPCCSACAEDGVCAFCILRAFQAVKWKDAAPSKWRRGVFMRLSVIVALCLWLLAVAVVRTVTGIGPPAISSGIHEAATLASMLGKRGLALAPPSVARSRSARSSTPSCTLPPARETYVEGGTLTAPRILDIKGPRAHDPRALLAEAERLASSGVDITILKSSLSPAVTWSAQSIGGGPARVTPLNSASGGVAGARIEGFAPDSFPILAGLSNGDVITSINGYAVSSPEVADLAYEASRKAGMAVAEVLRGARRLVVEIKWPESRGNR